jgi:hypothetical protein
MPYDHQLRIQRRVRRAILAAAAIAGLFLLLAVPERMLGWSGLRVGTPAVTEALAVPELTAMKPVAALRTPPSLDHLAFPAYAEWTEAAEESCVDCDWIVSYGRESLVDAVDTAALVELERSSTPTERPAEASYLASGFRGLGGGAGGIVGGAGGSGLAGGGSSLGAAANAEEGTSSQAATAPLAEEVSEAPISETSEAVAETGGVPAGSWGASSTGALKESNQAAPPSLVTNAPPSLPANVGSQAPDASPGLPDAASTLAEAGVINPLHDAGASYSGQDPRNVPPTLAPSPPLTPEPPATPEPPTAAPEPPVVPDTPTQPETPTEPDTPVLPAVPEPTQLILMGIALSAVVYRMRRG